MILKELYENITYAHPCGQDVFLSHVDTTVRALIARYGEKYVLVPGSAWIKHINIESDIPVHEVYFPAIRDNILFLITDNGDRKTDFINEAEDAYKHVWRMLSRGRKFVSSDVPRVVVKPEDSPPKRTTTNSGSGTAPSPSAPSVYGATAHSLPAGSDPTATYQNNVFSFGIPAGADGQPGQTPNFQIGTVTTGAPGSQADASITGTPENPRLNLTIPRGESGGSSAEYKLSDVYESHSGRVKVGSVGNPSAIDSASDWVYYDIPVSDYISYLYSNSEYVPANNSGAFIHVLDENNVILDLVRANQIYNNENIYDYINGNGVIDFEYIQNTYSTVKKVRICFYIPSAVDFYVCKLTPHEAMVNENRDNAEVIQRELLKSGKNTLADLNKQHGRCLNFAFITDTHVYPHEGAAWSCTNNIDLFVKASAYSDFAVHCGDVVESGNMNRVFPGADATMSREDWLANLDLAMSRIDKIQRPMYIMRGNHDVNSYGRPATGVPVDLTTIIYNTEWNALTQNKRGDVVLDEDNPFWNYFYKDFDPFKVRVILLNHYADEETGQNRAYGDNNVGYQQVKWFAETALDLTDKDDPSEWSVLLFTHDGWYETIKYFLIDFMTGGDPSSVITDPVELEDFEDEYADVKTMCGITVDYSTQGAVPFVGGIHGGAHVDGYDKCDGIFNVIGVDQSFVKMWVNEENTEIGTPNEYCVDYFTIDTANHTVYETRMGRGSDRAYHYGTTAAEHYQITT